MVETASAAERYFPATPRVIYKNSPLLEVICQVRFPTILRIESEPPAAFQEAIRTQFPMLERSTPAEVNGLPPDLARMIGMVAQQAVQYNFKSEDDTRILALAPDFLALTSRSYGQWENFLELLVPALTALESVYKPSFYGRVGLRYQNAIYPEQLGLDAVPWSNLLSPNILGELAADTIPGTEVLEAHRHLRLRFTDGPSVYLQHGLGTVEDGQRAPYIIDTDFYSEQKTELKNELDQLHQLHRLAGRAFRWCISEHLHQALEPEAMG